MGVLNEVQSWSVVVVGGEVGPCAVVLAAKRPEKASLRPFTTGDGLETAGPKTELFCYRERQIQWFRAESGRVMVGDCRVRFCCLAVCVWTLLFSDGQILAENSGIKNKITVKISLQTGVQQDLDQWASPSSEFYVPLHSPHS